ncbi:MAG: DUF4369 domain-containing protein [Paraprevotella sp.]|nr:DUF4369 domain-containing protein [Paraprevotella sp.]MBP3471124.1 DUF4369 domain-containing protein [Paraprevotella sp.]
MKNWFAPLAALFLLASCSEQYRVEGNSSVNNLDGRMLYLKVFRDGDLQSVDSCEVVHGKFHFEGSLDSVEMVNLFMDDESVMPLVLEPGDIQVNISISGQSVTGTVLNDSLYSFIAEKNKVDEQLAELPRLESQMIMDGKDHAEIIAELSVKADSLAGIADRLVTRFVIRNMNNVLGPGVFMIVTSAFPYPMLTPQIEQIMLEATPAFKEHPYVKEFISLAEENMKRMNEDHVSYEEATAGE